MSEFTALFAVTAISLVLSSITVARSTRRCGACSR